MESETLISRRPNFKKALILAITAVITTFCLVVVFLGCTKEEVPVEATRQLVIPPECEPETVLTNFGGSEYDECVYDVENEAKICPGVHSFVEGVALEKDLAKGYIRGYWIYILKSDEVIGEHHDVLRVIVLKYKTQESAEEALEAFAEPDLRDLIFNGVKIKGVESEQGYPGPIYMLQSNEFVIYMDGNLEACRDAISAIIELYSVQVTKEY
jgi:hypothetical protein